MLIHPSDNLPFSGDPRKEELRQRLMRPDAPKVMPCHCRRSWIASDARIVMPPVSCFVCAED